MQHSQQSQMTWKQKMDLTKAIFCLPSLSVIVFLRSRIGYRLLDAGWYVAVAFLVYLIGVFNYDERQPHPYVMQWYAVAIVVMGAFHRAVAWVQLRRGTQPHSYSTGLSWLGYRILPKWLRKGGAPNWLFDPALTFTAALIIHEQFSHALGVWLLIAGGSTLFLEMVLSANAAQRDMDVADGLIMAGEQSQTVKRWKGSEASTSDQSRPISTGIGDDLAAKIRARRGK